MKLIGHVDPPAYAKIQCHENWNRRSGQVAELATGEQHYKVPTFVAGIPTAGTRSTRLASKARGENTRSKLTFQTDQSVGAGQEPSDPNGYSVRNFATIDSRRPNVYRALTEMPKLHGSSAKPRIRAGIVATFLEFAHCRKSWWPGGNMKAAVVSSSAPESMAAGQHLAAELRKSLQNQPGALIVFAAPQHDHRALLAAISRECPDSIIVGASSAGEFTNATSGQGLACALGLAGEDVAFAASVGRDLKSNPEGVAKKIVSGFRASPPARLPFRAALVLTDALAGHADILVDQLTLATAGQYQFFGGGAGDNAQFQKTTVFCGDEVLSDAAVALEILSSKPLGIGVSHGWTPASRPYRVTASEGMRVISLDGFPAVEAFEEHSEEIGQKMDRKDPLPFFLHNIIGIDTGTGYRLRVPLAVDNEGAILCAAEVHVGSVIRIMRTNTTSAITAAKQAANAAVAAIPGQPVAALFFDCVATRLRMGAEFGSELAGIQEKFSAIPLTGCNTHGQIARAEGQFEGFHNCTAVVCVFPE